MSEPKRIQLRRTKGWRKPEGAIVVARPSKWGNPFKVSGPIVRPPGVGIWRVYVPPYHGPKEFEEFASKEDAASYAVERFGLYGSTTPGPSGFAIAFEAAVELRGHDLACWCPLDQPCHADVLLEWANR